MSYEELAKELIQETKDNTRKAARRLLHLTKERVPVVTGKLRDSGHIEETVDSVDVVFDAEHALAVHENPNGRGYKFLERTIDNNINELEEIIGGEGK